MGEYDLEGLFIRLGHAIDSIRAKRVVLDTTEGLLHALLEELPPATVQTEPVQPLLHLMQESVNRFQRTIEQLTDVSKL